ncbi:hypothetical protein OG552_22345 [Streptomyces sp. NBC_01476]|uniref:hypothetical protein n=1 Tax=Streptomyces sp. NBC_01476 TaxID=2903881 RepID=UPI002E376CFD|nr:hypothetical protein [Streptomyces sp. NBC_01476]
MKKLLGRTITFARDTLSGRRRLAKYTHPDAHRGGRFNPDAAIVDHYRPSPPIPPIGGPGF